MRTGFAIKAESEASEGMSQTTQNPLTQLSNCQTRLLIVRTSSNNAAWIQYVEVVLRWGRKEYHTRQIFAPMAILTCAISHPLSTAIRKDFRVVSLSMSCMHGSSIGLRRSVESPEWTLVAESRSYLICLLYYPIR